MTEKPLLIGQSLPTSKATSVPRIRSSPRRPPPRSTDARLGQCSGMTPEESAISLALRAMRFASPSGQSLRATSATRQGEQGMPEWEKKIGAINLVVGDLERSKAFYRDVFWTATSEHEDKGHGDVPLSRHVCLLAARSELTTTARQATYSPWRRRASDSSSSSSRTWTQCAASWISIRWRYSAALRNRDWGMRTLTFADPGGYTWDNATNCPALRSAGRSAWASVQEKQWREATVSASLHMTIAAARPVPRRTLSARDPRERRREGSETTA